MVQRQIIISEARRLHHQRLIYFVEAIKDGKVREAIENLRPYLSRSRDARMYFSSLQRKFERVSRRTYKNNRQIKSQSQHFLAQYLTHPMLFSYLQQTA